MELSDIAGDGFFTWNIYNNQQKPWVVRSVIGSRPVGLQRWYGSLSRSFWHLQAQLVTPYLVIFSVAAVVSVVSLAVKGKLFLEGLRSLNANAGPVTLDGVNVSAELVQLAPIVEITHKFADNLRARKKLYCAAALLAIEGT
jgi:hypothetical protein